MCQSTILQLFRNNTKELGRIGPIRKATQAKSVPNIVIHSFCILFIWPCVSCIRMSLITLNRIKSKIDCVGLMLSGDHIRSSATLFIHVHFYHIYTILCNCFVYKICLQFLDYFAVWVEKTFFLLLSLFFWCRVRQTCSKRLANGKYVSVNFFMWQLTWQQWRTWRTSDRCYSVPFRSLFILTHFRSLISD